MDKIDKLLLELSYPIYKEGFFMGIKMFSDYIERNNNKKKRRNMTHEEHISMLIKNFINGNIFSNIK